MLEEIGLIGAIATVGAAGVALALALRGLLRWWDEEARRARAEQAMERLNWEERDKGGTRCKN